MERSNWEADSRSAAQEIPCPLHNPKIHHSVHKNPNCNPALALYYKRNNSILALRQNLTLTFEKGNNSNNGNKAVT